MYCFFFFKKVIFFIFKNIEKYLIFFFFSMLIDFKNYGSKDNYVLYYFVDKLREKY